MEHEIATYFEESEEDAVTGFTIIGTAENEYHIAEKWNKDDGEDTWHQYHIPAEQLQARVSQGKCQPKAQLTDEQFEQVCQKVDFPEMAEKVIA